MKRGWVIILLLGLFLCLIAAKTDREPVTAEDQKLLPKASGLNVTDSDGKQHVIVLLKEPVQKINSQSVTQKKIAREQVKQKVLSRISNKVRNSYESFNGFSIAVTDEELERLKADESVVSITYNRPVTIFLQNSTVITNTTKTWPLQANAINLTGKDQTVCVIDTGINYTHANLGGCYGNNDPTSTCKVKGGYDYVNNDANPYDDHGHGTHVAGIVASNGSIKGIAPEANIIAIKVLASDGGGDFDDIVAGIDWCVNNATRFNITTISMSLGVDCDDFPSYCHTSYCDSDDPSTAAAINAAYAKNISVVIATGNDGKTTTISEPACIRNATRVASTTKADAISSFSNTNSIVNLVAPGSSINSTSITGSFEVLSGTSMATPTVSGAIALIRQFLDTNGIKKTPLQIELALNTTGKRILDPGNGLYFTRIDVYNATYYLDSAAPAISFITGSDTNASYISRTYIQANVTASDTFFSNITITLHNSSLSLINSSVNTSSTAFASFSGLSNGVYYLNATATDQNNTKNRTETRTITVDTISPAVQFVTPTDTNATLVNRTFILANVTATDTNLANITIYLYNATTLLNTTTPSTSPYYVNFSGLLDGVHCINATSTDLAGNRNITETRIVTVNATPLILQYVGSTETNNSYITRTNIVVNVTALNLSAITNISIRLYNSSLTQINISSSNIASVNMITDNLSDGVYYFNVSGNDSAGNYAILPTRVVTIDTTKPQIGYGLGTEANATNLSRSWVYINTSVNETNEKNITFVVYTSGSIINSTNFSNATRALNITTVADGSYFFNVTVCDLAANCNTTVRRSIIIDTTAPTINWINVSNYSQAGTIVNISINVTDSNTVASATANGRTMTQSGNVWNGTVIANSSNITILATDNFGNVVTDTTVRITIDNTAPVTTANITINGTSTQINTSVWYNRTLSVNLTVTEANSVNKTEYRFGKSGAWITYTVPFTTSANTSPDNTFQYRSIDNANNVEIIQSKPIRIDTTSPSISSIQKTADTILPEIYLNINVIVNDTESGVKNVTAILNGTTYNLTKVNEYYAAQLLAPLTATTYTISVIAFDNANNSNTGTSSLSVNATIPFVFANAINNSFIANGSILQIQINNTNNGTYEYSGQATQTYTNTTLLNITVSAPTTIFLINISAQNNNHTIVRNYNFTIDVVNPNVVIANLSANQEINGSTKFTVNASDNRGIANITLKVNNATYAVKNDTPYDFTINTLLYNNSQLNITAIATDYSGLTNQSTVSVIVSNNRSTIKQVTGGDALFDDSFIADYLQKISGINSSSVTAQVTSQIARNQSEVNDTRIKKEYVKLSITASTYNGSYIYFGIPTTLIQNISRVVMWVNHSTVFTGPFDVTQIDEADNITRFSYFTDSFSDFVVAEQYPACTVSAQITTTCTCGSQSYDSGFCCSGGYQTGACSSGSSGGSSGGGGGGGGGGGATTPVPVANTTKTAEPKPAVTQIVNQSPPDVPKQTETDIPLTNTTPEKDVEQKPEKNNNGIWYAVFAIIIMICTAVFYFHHKKRSMS